MQKEPSDVFTKDSKRQTRRRVMKAAAAAGFPVAAASSLTPQDVKAADSDQVTIPFDTEGNYKIQVDADAYDHYIRAKSVRNKLQNEYGDDQAIVGFSLNKIDQHHVTVHLNNNVRSSSETRGSCPSEKMMFV